MKSLKLLLRFAIIGGLMLLLLIPLLMIRGTINDRQRYRAEAVERVAQSKAGDQAFIGPVRIVPYHYVVETETLDSMGRTHKSRSTKTSYLKQAPQWLRIGGELSPDQRRIGLFRVPVYTWKATLKAEFANLELPQVTGRSYERPYLAIGLSDVRGLVGMPNLRADGQKMLLESGSLELSDAGVHAKLPELADAAGGVLNDGNTVEMEFVLDGTRSLSIAPIGDENQIALSSRWPHPLFGGRFLPHQRKVSDAGFQADWSVSSLASKAQSQALNGVSLSELEMLRVDLVDPVDTYTQADRASKYGMLFVLLTFVGFALFELIKRLPIHPLQYLLVGLALAIFFLLLLSLSEHIAFWQAYLISVAACIGLQFFYLSGVLRSWVRAAGFATMLTALYGVLYALLVSEDNALLMGSLMLFGILAAIMWITRKVDWYELGSSLR